VEDIRIKGLRCGTNPRRLRGVGRRAKSASCDCTKTWQEAVYGLQSTDFKGDRSVQFSLTAKIEGVKPYSFFGTFCSFADWCGVRGSSKVTFLLRNGTEGKQGSIAKRWSRRTGTTAEGKIESRGVELICPVGGEPGARAEIARCDPQGSDESRSARV
jgi:hypothetical protein